MSLPTKPLEDSIAPSGHGSLEIHARRGWVWGALEQFVHRGLGMIVSLVLARMLAPEAFGLLAAVGIFISVAQQIVDGGLTQWLMQKKEAGEKEYAMLFWCNMLLSVLACLSLILLSTPIAAFYGKPELRGIVIALAVSLFLMNAGRVQFARLGRDLKFKTLSWVAIFATGGGCVVGLAMAYWGFGVWALVGQHMAASLIKTSVLWCVVPWRPRVPVGWADLGIVYRFGLPVMSSQMLRGFAEQLINVMIARHVSMATLGFLDRGRVIPQNVGYSIGNIFSITNFPVLSKLQDNEEAFRLQYLRFLGVSTLIYFMLMTGLAVAADDVIRLLLGDRWQPSVWFLRLTCLSMAVYAVFAANCDVLRAKGRVKLFFRYNTLCAGLQVLGLVCGLPWGDRGMVLGDVAGRLVACGALMQGVAAAGSIRIKDQLSTLLRHAGSAGLLALPLLWVQLYSGLGLLSRLLVSGLIGSVAISVLWICGSYGNAKPNG